MEINDEMIAKLAKLSRLSFSGDEKEAIKADLHLMIGFIDKLHEVDTSRVEPLLHIIPQHNIYGDDVVEPFSDSATVFGNGAEQDTPFFKVPKVITK
ncbi:MAG: Asp-tRNA(Asn)/Glu-tRNA(Gln) amidotransferase subunit GatC [Bacteroidetes bacterium]|nr:Asp-tRNA(Asn)/Glu-tRNA(Gln) amidotransferase subunit GatC [Bacteroidota bacterium]